MRRSTLRASALVLALATACVGTRAASQLPSARVATGGPLEVMGAHPHGPDADDQERRADASAWSATLWPAGGRHPVWRGCQHVYNPALSSYLFGGAEPPG
jgi:hypothetical protein